MSLYVSDCLLDDSNVCRQSLGKAAAAVTLYTESVRQSVEQSQSLSVCQWELDSRLGLELDVENQFVRMLENGEDNK